MDSLKDNIEKSKKILKNLGGEDSKFLLGVVTACDMVLDAIEWTEVSDHMPEVPEGKTCVEILYEDEEGKIKSGIYSDDTFFSWQRLVPRPVRWTIKPPKD